MRGSTKKKWEEEGNPLIYKPLSPSTSMKIPIPCFNFKEEQNRIGKKPIMVHWTELLVGFLQSFNGLLLFSEANSTRSISTKKKRETVIQREKNKTWCNPFSTVAYSHASWS